VDVEPRDHLTELQVKVGVTEEVEARVQSDGRNIVSMLHRMPLGAERDRAYLRRSRVANIGPRDHPNELEVKVEVEEEREARVQSDGRDILSTLSRYLHEVVVEERGTRVQSDEQNIVLTLTRYLPEVVAEERETRDQSDGRDILLSVSRNGDMVVRSMQLMRINTEGVICMGNHREMTMRRHREEDTQVTAGDLGNRGERCTAVVMYERGMM
jgi:hypothetical protein